MNKRNIDKLFVFSVNASARELYTEEDRKKLIEYTEETISTLDKIKEDLKKFKDEILSKELNTKHFQKLTIEEILTRIKQNATKT